MSKIVGIDLGTTNSSIAVIENNKPVIIPNIEGYRLTPSIVAFTDDKVIVGDNAKSLALLYPKNTITSIKKLIGKKFSEIQNLIKFFPYSIVKIRDDDIGIDVKGQLYTPQEITAYIFQKLKIDAEAYLGLEVKDVVVTVPSLFDKRKIKATREAAEIAGLNVKRIVSEPTSACLAHSLSKLEPNCKKVIFDLGGGSLDVSILDIGDGVLEVLSNHGDLDLGGNDFDFAIVQWLLEEFKKQESVDLSNDPMVIYRFKEIAEKAKIELSKFRSTTIFIPLVSINSKIKNLSTTLSIDTFKDISKQLVEKCRAVCYEAINKANKYAERNYRKTATGLLNTTIHNQEADSQFNKINKDRLGEDTISHYEEVSNNDIESEFKEIIFVGGSTRMPFLREAICDVFKIGFKDEINPDETVALGAAVQGGVLSGEIKDTLLLDSTSLKLGIRVSNEEKPEFFTFIIEGTTIPTKQSYTFLNYHYTELEEDTNLQMELLKPVSINTSGLQVFEIDILEADEIAEKSIGKLVLDNVQLLEGRPNKIKITFDIDANQLLHVSALDVGSGISNKLRIEGVTGLLVSEKDEIEGRFTDFETNYKRFQKDKELLDLANDLFLQSESQTIIYGSRISTENKNQLLKLLLELKVCIETKNTEPILCLIDSLNKTWQSVSQELYLNSNKLNFNNMQGNTVVQLFISYSHKDEEYKNKLINHLSPLRRLGLINIWNDREIIAGTLWEENGIYKNLKGANIIILLVSSDFIASNYCFDNEIEKALYRYERNEVLIIPIIIRPTLWQKLKFSKIQALPKDAKPISVWINEDEAWKDVVEGIEKAIDYIQSGNLLLPSSS